MSHAIVLLSGGIDSATCFATAVREYDEVTTIHVNYGQQTAALEQQQAFKLEEWAHEESDAEISSKHIDYKDVFKWFGGGVASDRDSFVTDDGSLEEDDGRSTGYVPMRNLHLITTAAGVADVSDADAVFHGAQGGDEAAYPDCRPSFMDAAQMAINDSLGDNDSIKLRTPLLKKSKTEVIQTGENLGVPWQYTYSCYEEVEDLEDPDPCEKCPACVERTEAFEEAGVEDPIHAGRSGQ